MINEAKFDQIVEAAKAKAANDPKPVLPPRGRKIDRPLRDGARGRLSRRRRGEFIPRQSHRRV